MGMREGIVGRQAWVWLVIGGLAVGGRARGDEKGVGWLLPIPEVTVDPQVPTLKAVVGHAWGEEISSTSEIERYMTTLERTSKGRAKVVPYGRSNEGRPLLTVVISSKANLDRLEEIRGKNLKLADPRTVGEAEAKDIAAGLPVVVWMAYGVHGDEISSGDAALLTAYHLLADTRPETKELLEKTVVVLDPMQNPDGRDRFVNFHRENRGAAPESEPLAAERVQRWAPGRFNHYLFDMNRDWFLQTQVETQTRTAAVLKWQPHVFIDAHEMGANNHYYFDPPADPIIELITAGQREWFARFGRRQGARFDQFGFPYTTRETYDAFYPGYGSTWPTMHGSIGILWEQASARGMVVDREDGTKLHFRDGVRHHYVSSISTVETAAANREALVLDFYRTRASAVELGKNGPVRDYLLLPGDTPARAARLADLLIKNGIEVRKVSAATKLRAKGDFDKDEKEHAIPAGSYHVPVAQPAARMVRALLDPNFDMGEAFRKRQLERKVRRLGDEIYDLTAWSLAQAYGVTALRTSKATAIPGELLAKAEPEAKVVGPEKPKVGYLVKAEDDAAMVALGEWLRAGFRVNVLDQASKLGGVEFRKGTLLLRTSDNPESLHEAVRATARRLGLVVHATDTGMVDEGAGLGGSNVTWVKPPKVLMLMDRPTSPFSGHTWYLFDQVWNYPVTRVPASSLSDVDLGKYNVLILPDGRYPGPLSDSVVARLKDWIRGGGTLITVNGATAWATEKSAGLLASKVIKKVVTAKPEAIGEPEKTPDPREADKKPADDKDKAEESPDPVPGAFLRVKVYDDHFVTFGAPKEMLALTNTDLILAPLKPTDGRNLVNFAAKDVLASGFCWPETLKLIAGSPSVLYQSLGKGHVVGFADDPNYRAMSPATQRFFLNAVFFGPGE